MEMRNGKKAVSCCGYYCFIVVKSILLLSHFNRKIHMFFMSFFPMLQKTLLPGCINDHFGDRIWLCRWTHRLLMRGKWNKWRRVHWRGSVLKQVTEVWPKKQTKKPIHFVSRQGIESFNSTTAIMRISFFPSRIQDFTFQLVASAWYF